MPTKKKTEVEEELTPEKKVIAFPEICTHCRNANKREMHAGRSFCLVGLTAINNKCDGFKPNANVR